MTLYKALNSSVGINNNADNGASLLFEVIGVDSRRGSLCNKVPLPKVHF